jgi:hypothetical protein
MKKTSNVDDQLIKQAKAACVLQMSTFDLFAVRGASCIPVDISQWQE